MRYLILLPLIILLNSCTNTKNIEIRKGLYASSRSGIFKLNYEKFINNNYITSRDTLKIYNEKNFEINSSGLRGFGTYSIKSDSLFLDYDSTITISKNEVIYKKYQDTLLIINEKKIIRKSKFRFCEDDSYSNNSITEFEFVKPY